MDTYIEIHTYPGGITAWSYVQFHMNQMILQLTCTYSDWKNYIYFKKILLLFKDAVLHSLQNFSLGSFGQACSSTTHCPHQLTEGVAVLHVSHCLQ